MSAPLFLAAREQLIAGERIQLSGSEARHAATVRRLRPGERVDVTDGAGLLVEGVVATAGRDEIDITVCDRRQESAPTPRLVVVQALAKGDRDEQAVEAMTEVGVDVIVPWAAERCVAKWQPGREGKGLARWIAKARAAAKQSRRVFLPEISGPAELPDVVTRLEAAERAVVLDGEASLGLGSIPVPEHGDAGDIVVVVGPEGGMSRGELAAFAQAGAVSARLGPTVLRTSTAGVAAAAVLLSRCGRW